MIELKKPADGARISLQTSVQKEFVREGRKYLTGELDLDSFRWQFGEYTDKSRPLPVSFRWEMEDGLSSTLEISTTPDFSDIFTSVIARNKCDVYNFEIGKTYYWRVRNLREESPVFSFSTADEAPRFMYFDGTTNVRDIGGYVNEEGCRVKQGLVFRGAELDMHQVLSHEGIKTMHDTFGIKSDIDLRGEAIGFTESSPIGKDVNYLNVRLAAYEEYIKEPNFKGVNEIFTFLADKNNYPVYFHCWGGADRTGCIAFTLEAILGLDEETLMKNFEITCLSGMGNVKNRDETEFSNMVNTLMSYGENWKERMTKFLIICGVTRENIEKIREIMLEKA